MVCRLAFILCLCLLSFMAGAWCVQNKSVPLSAELQQLVQSGALNPPARNDLAVAVDKFNTVAIMGLSGDSFIAHFTPTGSMRPTIGDSSMAVVEPMRIGDIAVGDVIVFRALASYTATISHRVVSINYDGLGLYLTTRGDNNTIPDKWKIRDDDIIGVVRVVIN